MNQIQYVDCQIRFDNINRKTDKEMEIDRKIKQK